jgi:hypothetical protein
MGLFFRAWIGATLTAFTYLAVVLYLAMGAAPDLMDILHKSVITALLCAGLFAFVHDFKILASKLTGSFFSALGITLLVAKMSSFDPTLINLAFLIGFAVVLGAGCYAGALTQKRKTEPKKD